MNILRWAAIAALLTAGIMPAQNYKIVFSFGNALGTTTPYDSYIGPLQQSRGGALFGAGDTDGTTGKAFRLTTSGALTIVHSFNGTVPVGGLVLARSGFFWGTTTGGGAYEGGQIFKMTPDGSVTSWDIPFTGYPEAPPIQSLAGDFYGTITQESGSIYRITNDGIFTELHRFVYTDGAHPWGRLFQATNYWFYGTTLTGGAYDHGTIFRINSSGTLQTLFSFGNGPRGSRPTAGLIQASDGNFYGMTSSGGASGDGVIYKMTPDGIVSALHSFTGGSDGQSPQGELVEATDGNLYGTLLLGGALNGGVLFRITRTGSYTVLHSFDPATGSAPHAGLMQHTNGLLYGTLGAGGPENGGAVFSYNIGAAPFVTYVPVYGRVGTQVEILGQGFTSSSIVSFNGAHAEATEVHQTFLRATVPSGATSGYITVTTASGTLKSNKEFLIRP